jgi:hypothetical protein
MWLQLQFLGNGRNVKMWVLGFEEEKMKWEDVSFFEFKMNIECKKMLHECWSSFSCTH